MKKLLLLLSIILLASCEQPQEITCDNGFERIEGECVKERLLAHDVLMWELENTFNLFWEQANTNEGSGENNRLGFTKYPIPNLITHQSNTTNY